MIRNWLINTFLLASLVGVLDAGYLTISHFRGSEAGCFLVEGCDTVLTSQYADIFGIPVALFGLVYYLAIFIVVFAFNFNRDKTLLMRGVSFFTIGGLLATLWFLYLQAFVLGEFCSYCLLSALSSLILFGLGMYTIRVLNYDLPPPSVE